MNSQLQPETTCVVGGGGPAGAVLSYMLARQGISVALLEMHLNFERDFRGDTLHPSTLEIMDELGLAERLLALPHTRLSQATLPTEAGPVTVADLSSLKTKFPFVALMPQARFLDFVTGEAKRFPNFQLIMGATVDELIEDGANSTGVVRGVRYRADGGRHELRAALTVGADGRFSKLRQLSGLGQAAIHASPPMDVLWFRLPRKPDDPHGLMGRLAAGHVIIQLDRGAEWQIAFIIRKDSYRALRAAGLEALRREITTAAPELADRVDLIHDWQQVSLLSVQADRLPLWYRPGLLLIGDAAHVMSPAGGNGINYAINDAVAAANILAGPLKAGHVSVDDLARVQRRRERPTRIIQGIVNVMQEQLLRPALESDKPLTVPNFVPWPVVRHVMARVIGFGVGREHVAQPRP
jgi:2-polyprenyl-6-methoxyphenol hydroxylase-like FAD-dependent oxidoreductase